MPLDADRTFQALLGRLQTDADVLGAFLSGSRGKGFATEHSDYDVVVIVRDGALARCRARYPFRYAAGIDCVLHDLTGFRNYAAYGSPDAWDRYDFAHVEVLFDHTGNLPRLLEEKGRIPTEHQQELLRGSLDAYVNGVYRSLKCLRNASALGAKLEAAVSISALLTFLFALEGRHAPFPGYLERELSRYPLHLPLPPDELLSLIDRALVADLEAQQALLKTVDGLARDAGLGDVLTDWGDDYGWMQTFSCPHRRHAENARRRSLTRTSAGRGYRARRTERARKLRGEGRSLGRWSDPYTPTYSDCSAAEPLAAVRSPSRRTCGGRPRGPRRRCR